MSHATTQDLLKKINYIEADIEIQKQILFSIPSDQKDDLEKTVSLIAAKKKEIDKLRQQIQKQDPEEYQRIVVFEKALQEFKKLAADKPFQSISSRNVAEGCVLPLGNGEEVECLVKAYSADGNWTVITLDGKTEHYSG
ncbi:MAG: hypothetical protein ACWGOX_10390, partial [Desulforhopalus sp.]